MHSRYKPVFSRLNGSHRVLDRRVTRTERRKHTVFEWAIWWRIPKSRELVWNQHHVRFVPRPTSEKIDRVPLIDSGVCVCECIRFSHAATFAKHIVLSIRVCELWGCETASELFKRIQESKCECLKCSIVPFEPNQIDTIWGQWWAERWPIHDRHHRPTACWFLFSHIFTLIKPITNRFLFSSAGFLWICREELHADDSDIVEPAANYYL